MKKLMERLHLVDYCGVTMLGICVGAAFFMTAVLAVAFVGTTYGGRAYGGPTCHNWGQQTGIRTKFVVLNWADSGTCLAQTPSGRWVPNSNWQSFVNGNK